jgi:deazaflavin-dependent oxidoreductase (nitroreductase family)
VNAGDFKFKASNAVHRTLFRASKGKIGGKMIGMPALELVTIGRKTGQKRSTMLTAPLQEDGRIIIVASKGGYDHDPAWFLNLSENPDVEVLMEGKSRPMKARVTTGDERADLWARLTAAHKNYAGYQTKTTREIPVVVLEPA